jgi:RNA polymerase sigma-70 factor (ECF subfamily)
MAKSAEKILEIESTIEQFSQLIRSAIRKTSPQIDLSDMDDIEQEVKIKIWREILNSEKEIHNFGSYIWKVTYTTTCRIMKKLFLQRKQLLLHGNSGVSIEDFPQLKIHNPDRQYEKKELIELIRRIVDELIDSRRQVLKLYLMGMDLDEISEFFNWSDAKTRNLLSRGLADLRRGLLDKGIQYKESS